MYQFSYVLCYLDDTRINMTVIKKFGTLVEKQTTLNTYVPKYTIINIHFYSNYTMYILKIDHFIIILYFKKRIHSILIIYIVVYILHLLNRKVVCIKDEEEKFHFIKTKTKASFKTK